ncbi:MAG: polysaccharide biosynthesis protein, partial [Parcubacteria group bacterium Gr01-1014_106]
MNIRTVQLWGVFTKMATVVLGVVQTAVVLRLLGPESYGIVGIVTSLGALVGVSQHVGAVDAAIREIAVADTPQRRASVFWVSLWFRLIITVPISVLLALAASWIGTRVYAYPDMPHFVRLMSVTLVLYGIQGILGGAYTGKQAFGTLYALQVITAAANVPLFAGLVWWRGVVGFFEA